MHLHLNQHVAAGTATQTGHTLATQGEMVAGLHSGRNIELTGTVDGGDIDRTAQRGRGHGQGHTQEDGLAFPLKMFVRIDMQDHVQIP